MSQPHVPTATTPELLAMRSGLDGAAVRAHLAESARGGETRDRTTAFYLVEMAERRLHQETGHASALHYAEARLELDRRRAAELLRVGRALLTLREVDRAFCEGRIGWSKLLILVRMAVPAHEQEWLERAVKLDVRGLTRLASRSREGGPPRKPGDEKGLPEIRFPLSASLPPLVHAMVDSAQRRLSAELSREVDLVELLGTVFGEFLATAADGSRPGRKTLNASIYRVVLTEHTRGGPLYVESEDGPVPIDAGDSRVLSECARCDAGASKEHGRRRRARDGKTSPALRALVLRRDGRRCRACGTWCSLNVHHIAFRGRGGCTSPHNLVTLCTRCHALVHAKLLVIRGASAEVARFYSVSGRALADPDPRAPIAPPEAPAIPAAAPREVTLASLPTEVDPTWWRRHAHLVKDRGEDGSLRFEAGVPLESAEASPAPTTSENGPGKGLESLIGQAERVERLRVALAAAKARGKRVPHVLLTGPAGTGKTSVARAFAAEAGRPLVEALGSRLTDRAAWLRLLADLPEGCVLFLDEGHLLPAAVMADLLPALAEGRLPLLMSDGVRSRTVSLRLPSFTLVLATTDAGALAPALVSRFPVKEALSHYGEAELTQVVLAAAAGQSPTLSEEGARRLVRAARGTPREALALLERVQGHALVKGEERLEVPEVERALAHLGYRDDLTSTDQQYLAVLHASSDPVPGARLACLLGTTVRTLEEHVEPWLHQRGLVRTTPRGRVALPYARRGRRPGRVFTLGRLEDYGYAPNVRQGPQMSWSRA